MRKVLPAVAGLAGLLAGALTVPAAHAAATIGDVRIGWADAAHTQVRITWSETAPVANTLTLDPDSDPGWEPISVPVGAPDEYAVPASRFPTSYSGSDQWQVVVSGGGAEARSAAFDTYPGRMFGLQVTFSAYNRLGWTASEDLTDATPNDPLDLTGTTRYQVSQGYDPDPQSWGDTSCEEVLTESSTPSGIRARTGRPFELRISAVNEWGTSSPARRDVDQMVGIGVDVSRSGRTTRLTGDIIQAEMLTGLDSGPPQCDELRKPADRGQRPVIVHQRTSATAPWSVVGTTTIGDSGRYTAVFANPGPRQYRVVIASEVGDDGRAVFGADSATVTVPGPTR